MDEKENNIVNITGLVGALAGAMLCGILHSAPPALQTVVGVAAAVAAVYLADRVTKSTPAAFACGGLTAVGFFGMLVLLHP